MGDKLPIEAEALWRMPLTPNAFPVADGNFAAEVYPFSYLPPPVAKGQVDWVSQQVARSGELLGSGELAAAMRQLDVLQIVPGNLIDFRRQYPAIWKRELQPLLLRIATALHAHAGVTGKLPYYAPQAKAWLKRWTVVQVPADGTAAARYYTYRADDLQRGSHPRTSECDPHLITNTPDHLPYVEVFSVEQIVLELEYQLLRSVTSPLEIACYDIPHPTPITLTVQGADQTVGEQTTVALTAEAVASGFALVDLRWKNLGGEGRVAQIAPGLWQLRTPKVVTDGVVLSVQVEAKNALGRVVTDDVRITVNNTINELPTVTLRGPRSADAGTTIALTAHGADENPTDRAQLTYQWRIRRGTTYPLQVAPDGRRATIVVPRTARKEELTIEVTATDSHRGVSPPARHRVALSPVLRPERRQADLETVLAGNPKALARAQLFTQLGQVIPVSRRGAAAGKDLVGRIIETLHETPKTPQTIIFCPDNSNSMDNNLRDLVNQSDRIAAEIKQSAPESRIGIVSFGDGIDLPEAERGIRHLQPLMRTGNGAADMTTLRRVVGDMVTRYGTGIEYLALVVQQALDEFAHAEKIRTIPATGPRKIVVLTDEKGDVTSVGASIEEELAAAKTRAEKMGVEVTVLFIVDPFDVEPQGGREGFIQTLHQEMTLAQAPYATMTIDERVALLRDATQSQAYSLHAQLGARWLLVELVDDHPRFRTAVAEALKAMPLAQDFPLFVQMDLIQAFNDPGLVSHVWSRFVAEGFKPYLAQKRFEPTDKETRYVTEKHVKMFGVMFRLDPAKTFALLRANPGVFPAEVLSDLFFNFPVGDFPPGTVAAHFVPLVQERLTSEPHNRTLQLLAEQLGVRPQYVPPPTQPEPPFQTADRLQNEIGRWHAGRKGNVAALPKLYEILRLQIDPMTYSATLRSIATIGDRSAVPEVRAFFHRRSEYNDDTQIAALKTLAALGENPARLAESLLARILESGSSFDIRAVVDLLEQCGDPHSAPVLQKVYDQYSGSGSAFFSGFDDAIAAARALRAIGRPLSPERVWRLVAPEYTPDNWYDRDLESYYRAIQELQLTPALPALRQQLQNAERIRPQLLPASGPGPVKNCQGLLRALGAIGEPDDIPALAAWLLAANAELAFAAREAIREIEERGHL